MMLDQQLLHTPALDHRNLDLDGADRVTYLLEQSFRYDYPEPVHELRHRLVVLPPARHGNQHLRAHRVDVARRGRPARDATRRARQHRAAVTRRAGRAQRAIPGRGPARTRPW